jgi:ubiquinone biosynthesis protein
MFVRLGQVLPTRSDRSRRAWWPSRAVQDQVAPGAAGAGPVAAASIAQAYRARLRGGGAVVKVQRPGIAESVDRDMLALAERDSGGQDPHSGAPTAA